MVNYKKFNILTWKEDLITLAVIVVCLGLFFLFPSQGPSQAITASLIFLFLVPFLYVKLILKKHLRSYGWQIGDWKKGILFAAVSLALSLLIFYAFYHYTNFPKAYKLPLSATQTFWFFLFYEFLIVGFFLALYEFFFRGFFMFSFSGKIGLLAVAFQWFLFMAFLYLGGNFTWQNFPYIVAAAFSGLIAWKSRSLVYSFLSGFLFIVIADALVIKFFQ